MRPGDEGAPPLWWWAWQAIRDDAIDLEVTGRWQRSRPDHFLGQQIAVIDLTVPKFTMVQVFESGRALGLYATVPKYRLPPRIDVWDLAWVHDEALEDLYEELAEKDAAKWN